MRTGPALAVIAAAGVVGLAAFIRLAPHDPARWHLAPDLPGEGDAVREAPGGHAAAVVTELRPQDALERIDAAARDTPRTTRLAGSVEEGLITYVTRSRVWGFPDYTTVAATPHPDGARVVVDARLRFGQSDLGVNRARVEAWLSIFDS
ncbi:MAG: DUF1499 domain-containing protein [Pseudomonadota bacterium]